MKKARLLSSVLTVILIISMLSLFAQAAELTGSSLTIVSFSSEQDDPENIDDDYEADFAVDGADDTFWSNQYNPEAGGEPPHFLVIDMGSSVNVAGFKYLPRQDGYNGIENGDIGDYEVYIGDDPNNLTTLAYSGSFTAFGPAQQSATFTAPATGRYMKLVSPTQRWIAIAELTVVTQEATENPTTGDTGITLTILMALVSLAAIVKFRKAIRA